MVYKYIDIVGTSDTDISAAADNAFKEASSTVKNIKWGELGRVTFRVEEGKKMEYLSILFYIWHNFIFNNVYNSRFQIK